VGSKTNDLSVSPEGKPDPDRFAGQIKRPPVAELFVGYSPALKCLRWRLTTVLILVQRDASHTDEVGNSMWDRATRNRAPTPQLTSNTDRTRAAAPGENPLRWRQPADVSRVSYA